MIRPRARIPRPKGPLQPAARGAATPAPIRGWNARDAQASMKPDEAILLDNWFPEQSRIRVRRGSDDYLTGLAAPVESLMTWNGPSSSKMFAASGSAIYDATSAGAVGAAVQSSLSNARWQHTMFGTSGGAYLYMVNGADAPRYYSGSWTTPSLSGSGLTVTNLIHVNVFKRRLFFIESASLSFWYLPVESISGTLSEFDLAPLCALGGYLMAMGTWTRDGGAGEDDLAVFITSRGEAIVYRGLDPGDASLWYLVGVFRIGAPIGRRCLMKLGGDLVVLTEDGFVALSRVISGGRQKSDALSDRISGAVGDAVRSHRSKFGWQPILYPGGGMALFNVPLTENATQHQYVLNTDTGAWCRFKGWNANCFELLGDELYFGGADAVVKADTGLSDNGADIQADARPAFSYFGMPSLNKKFMARPILVSDGDVDVAMALNVDFEERAPTSTATFTVGGAEWDEAIWDVSEWSDTERVRKDWKDVTGIGKAASLWMRTVSNEGLIYWAATEWLYEPAPAGLL